MRKRVTIVGAGQTGSLDGQLREIAVGLLAGGVDLVEELAAGADIAELADEILRLGARGDRLVGGGDEVIELRRHGLERGKIARGE